MLLLINTYFAINNRTASRKIEFSPLILYTLKNSVCVCPPLCVPLSLSGSLPLSLFLFSLSLCPSLSLYLRLSLSPTFFFLFFSLCLCTDFSPSILSLGSPYSLLFLSNVFLCTWHAHFFTRVMNPVFYKIANLNGGDLAVTHNTVIVGDLQH